jgi:hypothetical protein
MKDLGESLGLSQNIYTNKAVADPGIKTCGASQ